MTPGFVVSIDGKPWQDHPDADDIRSQMQILEWVKSIDPVVNGYINWKKEDDEASAAFEVASMMKLNPTWIYVSAKDGEGVVY